jgi:hypothetical protein
MVDADPDKRSVSLSSISGKEDIQVSIAYYALSGAQHIFVSEDIGICTSPYADFWITSQIPVTMEYHTTEGSEKRRLLKTCIKLRTALPLDVTVHDYRRKDLLVHLFPCSQLSLTLKFRQPFVQVYSLNTAASTSSRKRRVAGRYGAI